MVWLRVLISLFLGASAAAETWVIEGEWRIHDGAEPEWTAADFDDSSWPIGEVPGWVPGSTPLIGQRATFRITFIAPPASEMPERIALETGRVASANEVWLNGQFIGRKGEVRRSAPVYTPPGLYSFYPLAPGALKPGQPNQLTIQVQAGREAPGLHHIPQLSIPAAAELRKIEAEGPDRRVRMLATFFTIASAAIAALMWALLPRERIFGILCAFFATILLSTFLQGFEFFDLGWSTPTTFYISQRLFLVTHQIFIILVASLFELKVPKLYWWTQLPMLFLLSPLSAGDGKGGIESLSPFDIAYLIVFVAPLLCHQFFKYFLAFRAFKSPYRVEAILFLASMIISTIIYMAGVLPTSTLIGSSRAFFSYIGLIIFDVNLLLVFAWRFRRLYLDSQRLSAQILTAHEDERRRISSNLHDGVAQSLHGLRLKVKTLELQLKNEEADSKQAGQLADDLQHALNELRAVSHDLHPAHLENQQLLDILRAHAAPIAAAAEIELEIEGDESIDLEPRKKEHLYRIFQEGFGNAVRHAQASRIQVSLKRIEPDAIQLVISDDGRGFDPAAAGGGIGLVTMEERAKLLGGWMKMTSRPDLGAEVVIQVSGADGDRDSKQ